MKKIKGVLSNISKVDGQLTYGVGACEAVDDYNLLFNKPQINSVELIGNRSFDELGLNSMSNFDIDRLIV